MEQKRWWLTPKQQEKHNEQVRKQAEQAIRAGTYREPIQEYFALDLNHKTNRELPVPADAQYFQAHQGHIPVPPQIPDDLNIYYRPLPKPCKEASLGRYYQLELRELLHTPQDPLSVSPEEQDYLDNNPFRES